MSKEPTIKEQCQAIMDVVPGFAVLMLAALVVAVGKACLAFATGNPTFEGAFGLVGGFAWIFAVASGFAVGGHSCLIKKREEELVRARLRSEYGAQH